MLIVGSPVSPYVRKVVIALAMKGLDYALDPIVPFYGTEAFTRISPLRRIPVLIDGDLVLNDSTVICEYLDEAYPGAPLLPKAPADRARARWIEEYADSRLGDVVIWRLFFATIMAPRVYQREPDADAIARVREVDLPHALDWIEAQAPEADRGFLFGTMMLPDITIAAFFRNALLAGFAIDADRWPRTAAWVGRVEAEPVFAETIRVEQIIFKTSTRDRAEALRAAGVRIAAESYGGTVPQARVLTG